MAALANGPRFYRLFNKALPQFYYYQRKNYPIKYVTVEDEGKSWYVSKQAFLKLFRLYNPWYIQKVINDDGDDEHLIKSLSDRQKLGKDKYLQNLLTPESVNPPPEEVEQHLETAHQNQHDPQRHIAGQNLFAHRTEQFHKDANTIEVEPEAPEGAEELVAEDTEEAAPAPSRQTTTRPQRGYRPPPVISRRRTPQSPFQILPKPSIFTNPWVIIGLAVGGLILLMLLMRVVQGTAPLPPYAQTTSVDNTDSLTITKTGTTEVAKRGEINYKITVTYSGPGVVNLKIIDTLPSGTTFKDTGSNSLCNSSETGTQSGQDVTWSVARLSTGQSKTVCLNIIAPDEDTYLSNSARAEITPIGAGDLSLVLKGPAKISDVNTPIQYILEATYKGEGTASVDLSYVLPQFTKDPSTASFPGCNASTEDWQKIPFKQLETKTFCLTLSPTPAADKQRVTAVIKGLLTINKTLTAVTAAQNIPASDSDCGGKYSTGQYPIQINPLKKNFGDPECSFNKDQLFALLKASDPKEYAFWIWMIAYESSYIPNAYSGGAQDKAGAWGLYQMGRGKNGALDHGDVTWQLQTTNAIGYKNALEAGGTGFRSEGSYWHVMRPSYCSEFPKNCGDKPN